MEDSKGVLSGRKIVESRSEFSYVDSRACVQVGMDVRLVSGYCWIQIGLCVVSMIA